MATKSLTDLGATFTRIAIEREGSVTSARVTIRTADVEADVRLDGAAIGVALTGPEVTALKATLAKLYAAALTAAGYA